MKGGIICWWSGGVTSAIACKLSIDLFGLENCRFIFIDTKNEDKDTYRFMKDCEKWYGKKIESITGIGKKYKSIQDVWVKHKSLNVATGAICSSELKREVRKRWEKNNSYDNQVFGFDINEPKRAKGMKINYAKTNPIFPLLLYGYSKKDCIEKLLEAEIDPPITYQLGFHNNNCFKTGCVQGGIGYWQKIQREYPEKFDEMAEMEHHLTELSGQPITMLKDQGEEADEAGSALVFLKPHPKYPNIKDITMMKGREPKPLFECNGFCGINDLEPKNLTSNEINISDQLGLFDQPSSKKS